MAAKTFTRKDVYLELAEGSLPTSSDLRKARSLVRRWTREAAAELTPTQKDRLEREVMLVYMQLDSAVQMAYELSRRVDELQAKIHLLEVKGA